MDQDQEDHFEKDDQEFVQTGRGTEIVISVFCIVLLVIAVWVFIRKLVEHA